LTLIEAMANAQPVVATAVGGVVDLLGEPATDQRSEQYVVCERGLRIASGDPDAFAVGLKRLVDDEPLRRELGDRGLQFVNRYYSKDRLLNDVRSLYDELLKLEPANVKVAAPEPHVESRI
jgi:glycosyltransferase involved in cell wall biosynthesis